MGAPIGELPEQREARLAKDCECMNALNRQHAKQGHSSRVNESATAKVNRKAADDQCNEQIVSLEGKNFHPAVQCQQKPIDPKTEQLLQTASTYNSAGAESGNK